MEEVVTQTMVSPPQSGRLLVLRGIVSLALGILALIWPAPGLLAITVLFGAYALANGIVTLAVGARSGKQGRTWGFFVVEGVIGIAAGAVTLFWPAMTLFILSMFAGVWALAVGILEVVSAFAFDRAQITAGGKILLAIAGILSLALGITVFRYPGLGAMTLLSFVAGYALIFGALMIALGAQSQRTKRQQPPVQQYPRAA